MGPCSSWNLRNYLRMRKWQLSVRQVWLSSIISNVTNNKNEPLWKTVRLKGLPAKPQSVQPVSIFFKFDPSVSPYVFTVLLIPSFHVSSGYFYATILTVLILINFETQILERFNSPRNERRSVTSRYHGSKISGSQQQRVFATATSNSKKGIGLDWQKKNNFARASRFFCTFLSRCCTTATWNFLISHARFVE